MGANAQGNGANGASSFTAPAAPRREKKKQLTETEARVLYTNLRSQWVPIVGYEEWMKAVKKLEALGGGPHCRHCTEPALDRKLGLCMKHLTDEEEP